MIITVVIFFAIIGACIGSFLNAAIFRMAKKESLIKGRSHCTKCGYVLSWFDLIPIFSYLALKGKCRKCDKTISVQYILIELVMTLFFAIIAWNWVAAYSFTSITNLELLRDLFIISALVFLFTFDLKYYLLPDSVTLPSIIIVFSINLYLGYSFYNLLLAVAVGAGFFAFQFIISKGKWIGGGDIRFGALMGAILGWPVLIVGLFLSYLIGAIFGSILLATGKKKFGSQLPFGTFLSIGTVIAMWWGSAIINWYFGLMV